MHTNARPRVRATLLVLVWFWAVTMFLVVDLFLNVPEFDGVRPRAPLYQAAREVAHEMVGEPVRGECADAVAQERPRLPTTGPFAVADARLWVRPAPLARPSSRHPGGRPDLRTPQGWKLFQQLRHAADAQEDPARRAAARRSLERMFGGAVDAQTLLPGDLDRGTAIPAYQGKAQSGERSGQCR